MLNNLKHLQANWDAPINVKTAITTRIGGYSKNQFSNFNLALHVGDDPDIVLKNRNILHNYLPSQPFWLNQTHSNSVINLDDKHNPLDFNYDASISKTKHQICTVMSADCLPILLTNVNGIFVAAIHAGWRGLLNHIITNTINMLNADNSTMLAYIGPSICQNHFEVGSNVFNSFNSISKKNADCFKKQTGIGKEVKYNCNLIELAKIELLSLGLNPKNIWISGECTYCNSELFYSYRKNNVTGRIASLIWLE